MTETKFQYPSNIVCPHCGKAGYVWYIDSEKYRAVCTDCHYFISKDEKPLACTNEINSKDVKENPDIDINDFIKCALEAGATISKAKNGKEGGIYVCGKLMKAKDIFECAFDVEETNLYKFKSIDDPEEFTNAIFHAIKVGRRYTDSRLGIIKWLQDTIWDEYDITIKE